MSPGRGRQSSWRHPRSALFPAVVGVGSPTQFAFAEPSAEEMYTRREGRALHLPPFGPALRTVLVACTYSEQGFELQTDEVPASHVVPFSGETRVCVALFTVVIRAVLEDAWVAALDEPITTTQRAAAAVTATITSPARFIFGDATRGRSQPARSRAA